MGRLLPLALFALLLLAGCKTELYGGLNEREANEMVAVLSAAGIPASKTREGRDGGLTVHVEESRFAEAMQLLNENSLPGRQYETMGDVFKKEGFVSSPTEERARLVYALSQELSQTVAEIDGVLTARIHVVLPETDMLGREKKPSSASVFIRYDAALPVEQYTAQIKLLVANSIEGLLYDNISVVMVPAAAKPASATADAGPAYEQVLGLWVHPASVGRLRAAAGGMAVGMLILILLLLRVYLGRRNAEPAFDDGL